MKKQLLLMTLILLLQSGTMFSQGLLGPDQTVCENIDHINLPCVGSGYWYDFDLTYGDGYFEGGAPFMCPWSSDYVPGPNDLSTGSVEFCLTLYYDEFPYYEFGCVIYFFQPMPLVDVGEDLTINSDETVTINATAQNFSSLEWSTSGDGTFDDDFAIFTGYTPGSNDIMNGTVDLCLTANGLADCESVTDCLTLTIIQSSSDIISLNAGWNLISFDVIPVSSNPENVFAPLISTNNLQMVTGFQNQMGVFFDPDGLPFLNTLQNLVPGEGYWVKVQNADTLTVFGEPIPSDFSINLQIGWNLIGYWPQETNSPALAFATLINAGILEMVTGYELGGKFYDPNEPPFLNTLLTIENGYGYWVKVNDDYEGFSYPAAWECGDMLMDERDGQTYQTVQIGDQCWMAENLAFLPEVSPSSQGSETDPYYYVYDYQGTNVTTAKVTANYQNYGTLYNWSASLTACPGGWHLPGDHEWNVLILLMDPNADPNASGTQSWIAGGKLKSMHTEPDPHPRWNSPNNSATNASNFTGFPGGRRHSDNGLFHWLGYTGSWWSAGEFDTVNAYDRRLHYNGGNVSRNIEAKSIGFSLRCLKDTDSQTFSLYLEVFPDGAGIATGGGEYEAGDQANIEVFENPGWEFVNWTDDDGVVLSEIPDFAYTMPAQDIILTANFIEEQVGFICGDTLVDSRDGQSYATVQIGDQCWMAENLSYLPEVCPSSQGSETAPYYYVYDYQGNSVEEAKATTNYQTNGVLYNWPASLTACPVGWHLPALAEWNILYDYVRNHPEYLCNSNTLFIAKALAAKTNWNISSNTCAVGNNLSTNNGTVFSGLPSGGRHSYGYFGGIGDATSWWSSFEYSSTNAFQSGLFYSLGSMNSYGTGKDCGFSVRCLRDETTPPTPYNLNLEVNPTGVGTVTGEGQYEDGEQVNISAEANPGWEFVNWTDDDGVVLSEIPDFAYTMPAQDIILTANFIEEQVGFTCGDTLVDSRDGQSYQTVQIGTQCWMAENLNIGTRIDGISNQINNGTIEKYCLNNIEANCDNYGGLYQWDEMMQYSSIAGSQGICPGGWHVPTDGEWTILTSFIGGVSSPFGDRLKSCRMVNSPLGGDCNTTMHPRWNYFNNSIYGTDDFGFSATPGGYRHSSGGTFPDLGNNTFWWSSTDDQSVPVNAWGRTLNYYLSSISYADMYKDYGFSVRCLKDN